MIRRFIETFGEYFMFLGKVFTKPAKWNVFSRKLIYEMDAMGIGSLLIVCIVSITLGSVITMQTAMQIESNWIPKWCVGYIVKTTAVMELCPTIISLLLVGNLGSRITAEIGSMRVTEQIDALEVMGIDYCRRHYDTRADYCQYLLCPAGWLCNGVADRLGLHLRFCGRYDLLLPDV